MCTQKPVIIKPNSMYCIQRPLERQTIKGQSMINKTLLARPRWLKLNVTRQEINNNKIKQQTIQDIDKKQENKRR